MEGEMKKRRGGVLRGDRNRTYLSVTASQLTYIISFVPQRTLLGKTRNSLILGDIEGK